ncbi:CDC27 family protein [Cytophagaceae bacterium ABcell3]|nr:CDC27 family protein [Cytophagaceae bacterium ABcell3]
MNRTVTKKVGKKKKVVKPEKPQKSNSSKYVFIGIGVFVGLVTIAVVFFNYMNYYSARNYLKEAKQFLEQGDEYWAMQYAKNALIRDNEYADAYLFKAGLLMEWKNYEECVSQIKMAMLYSDAPTIDMHFVYGKCLYKIGKYEEAYVHLDKVYEETPKRDSVSLFLGDIYSAHMLDYASAAKLYREFFDDHRNSVDAALKIGDSYYKLEDYDQAMKFYDVVLRIDDEHAGALYGMAKCCFKDEDSFADGCRKATLAAQFGHAKAEALLQTYCSDGEVDFE